MRLQKELQHFNWSCRNVPHASALIGYFLFINYFHLNSWSQITLRKNSVMILGYFCKSNNGIYLLLIFQATHCICPLFL